LIKKKNGCCGRLVQQGMTFKQDRGTPIVDALCRHPLRTSIENEAILDLVSFCTNLVSIFADLILFWAV